MKKHCGNCANHRKETNQFSDECGKCIAAILENGERTDPSHWREKPMTNADRIRAMSDRELAEFMAERNVNESTVLLLNKDHGLTATQIKALKHTIFCALMQWLQQPAEGD